MSMKSAGAVISTILRHDAKTASYKIALIRSLNDVILGYPSIDIRNCQHIAVPLRKLAEFWIAYYWPFVGTNQLLQGRPQGSKLDISFRSKLTELRKFWDVLHGTSLESDGYFLIAEMRSRHRLSYPDEFKNLYAEALSAIVHALRQPIRYAGPGEWTVFPKPLRWASMNQSRLMAIPDTINQDLCLLVSAELWTEFLSVSLWVEALCIHEWALFTESLAGVSRGKIYEALTSRPDNRRPLTWERNYIELLMMEGHRFVCPWTDKVLSQKNFDLDHLIPLAVYPINEMWNLVPSDRYFNQRIKRARLPRHDRTANLPQKLTQSYKTYGLLKELDNVLKRDSQMRFGDFSYHANFYSALGHSVTSFIEAVRNFRNVDEF